jgi:hypothetical protein
LSFENKPLGGIKICKRIHKESQCISGGDKKQLCWACHRERWECVGFWPQSHLHLADDKLFNNWNLVYFYNWWHRHLRVASIGPEIGGSHL